MVRDILYYPDHRLKTPCAPVTEAANAGDLIADLLDTMDACPPRTVGIAAPQIGAMWRVAIVDCSRNPKHASAHGLLTLINPRIEEQYGSQVFREGCLSLPDYTANVRRAKRIVVQALDIDMKHQVIEAEGFEAVVLQHEIDHLDGILFLDRIADIKADLFPRKSK